MSDFRRLWQYYQGNQTKVHLALTKFGIKILTVFNAGYNNDS